VPDVPRSRTDSLLEKQNRRIKLESKKARQSTARGSIQKKLNEGKPEKIENSHTRIPLLKALSNASGERRCEKGPSVNPRLQKTQFPAIKDGWTGQKEKTTTRKRRCPYVPDKNGERKGDSKGGRIWKMGNLFQCAKDARKRGDRLTAKGKRRGQKKRAGKFHGQG